jgi:hypothetical protein
MRTAETCCVAALGGFGFAPVDRFLVCARAVVGSRTTLSSRLMTMRFKTILLLGSWVCGVFMSDKLQFVERGSAELSVSVIIAICIMSDEL